MWKDDTKMTTHVLMESCIHFCLPFFRHCHKWITIYNIIYLLHNNFLISYTHPYYFTPILEISIFRSQFLFSENVWLFHFKILHFHSLQIWMFTHHNALFCFCSLRDLRTISNPLAVGPSDRRVERLLKAINLHPTLSQDPSTTNTASAFLSKAGMIELICQCEGFIQLPMIV